MKFSDKNFHSIVENSFPLISSSIRMQSKWNYRGKVLKYVRPEKHFNPEKLPLIFFSLPLSPILHHEFHPATKARWFFDLCLVKAQVRSALNLCDGKIFSESFSFVFSRLLSLSLFLLYSLFYYWSFFLLLIVVVFFNFVVCAAFNANHEKKCEKMFVLFLAERFFVRGNFLYGCVIKSRSVN